MKKAFHSVFKNKSGSDKSKDEDTAPPEKESLRTTSSISIGDLNKSKVKDLPPIFSSSRNRSSSGSTPNMDRTEASNDRPLSPSFKSSSSRLHRYSSDESNHNNSPTANHNSLVLRSGLDLDDSRLHTVAKGQGLTLICKLPQDSEGGESAEPIVTLPKSPGSDVDESDESPPSSIKIESRSLSSAAKSKFMSDGYSSETSVVKKKQGKMISSKDLLIEQGSSSKNVESRFESNGRKSSEISSSSSIFQRQDARQVKSSGDSAVHQQHALTKSSAFKVSTEELVHGGKTTYKSQKSVRHEEKNVTSSTTSSSARIFTKSMLTSASSVTSSSVSGENGTNSDSPIITEPFSPEDLSSSGHRHRDAIDLSFQFLGLTANEEKYFLENGPKQLGLPGSLMSKIEAKFSSLAEGLKNPPKGNALPILEALNHVMSRANSKDRGSQELAKKLGDILRKTGALDVLIENCGNQTLDEEVKYQSASLLEQGLSIDNRSYIVDNGLPKVVNLACEYANKNIVTHERVGTSLLSQLFKVSEETCKDIIKRGGLKAIVYQCRNNDYQTLRHCASALANVSLYGGPESHASMIKEQAPMWLFPLARHSDDDIAYYAFLAIATLFANKEIKADVVSSGTHELIEPFITDRNPEDFAVHSDLHSRGQSQEWLKRLALVLESDQEEARSLAAFHFAVEACIKQKQGKASELKEIGVIERLKRVASSPNAIASKYASQALKTLGEQVPHKLSQQVPLWTVQDVVIWVKQIGFENFQKDFVKSQIDGDLLLQLSEDMLKNDLKIENGILRKRFLRELGHLKRITDYSSCDTLNLSHILRSLGQVYPQYTYSMLQGGVDLDTIKALNEDQLLNECNVENSIHRQKIVDAINNLSSSESSLEPGLKKSLDAFISYRRSNGSQLASLLKVHLQLRGFSVFIDIERLEAGKFDSNLLNSIKQAKNFILVLTPNSLDRCRGDDECKDWVHKEIQTALQSKCNIIPIIDNFQWPEPESLPQDMRGICYFNGVRWIHEYQDACVDKLERFMKGELNSRMDGPMGKGLVHGATGPGTPIRSYPRAGSIDGLRSPPDTHA